MIYFGFAIFCCQSVAKTNYIMCTKNPNISPPFRFFGYKIVPIYLIFYSCLVFVSLHTLFLIIYPLIIRSILLTMKSFALASVFYLSVYYLRHSRNFTTPTLYHNVRPALSRSHPNLVYVHLPPSFFQIQH